MNLVMPLSQVKTKATLPASALSAEALLGEGRRHNAEDRMDIGVPTVEREQPWHIALANYLALGMSQTDAARELGVSQMQVSRVLRAPWFAERLAIKMRENCSDIMALFRGASLGAYATLVEVCEDKKMPPSVRVSAAKELLDRHLGKATQHVELKATASSQNPVEEAAALEAEIARLQSAPSGIAG